MKTLIVTPSELRAAGRWDIDYHLPALGIRSMPETSLARVSAAADVVKKKRDPTKRPDAMFQYIDISCIDVEAGIITRPQELTGIEAPSRARKVVHAYDIIISTCRPTRGAIAVVPEELHGQICSTGFSVIRAKHGMNPFYLHFALRLPSTSEQFRKWATGSSYPAILDGDVTKTLIPLPAADEQDRIAKRIRTAVAEREAALAIANRKWLDTLAGIVAGLERGSKTTAGPDVATMVFSVEQVAERLVMMPAVDEANISEGELFGDDDEDPDDGQI